MTESSAIDLSLSLPEILTNILDFLSTDQASLASAIQVNRKWFSCGTDVLWREAPCEVLAQVPEDRRQIYAAKVATLAFSGDDEAQYHSTFENIRFTNLKKISLDAYRPGGGESYSVLQYMQLPLETFFFYGGDLTDDLLAHLQNTCWRLRRIMIDSPGPNVTAASFFRFISTYKSLEHMTFLYGIDDLLTDELLLHLAGRPNLSSLAIGKVCSTQILQQISSHVSEPFGALQALQVTVPSAAVSLLVTLLPNVTSLQLTVHDSDVHLVQQLPSLTALRLLSVSFAASVEISRADILSLKSLSNLEQLSIGPDETNDAAEVTAFESDFSDADFDDLCSKLPVLRRIRFNVQCNLSAAALASLSKHCPLLEECTMLHVLNIHALDLGSRSNIMFPKLRLLDLGGFEAPAPNDQQGDGYVQSNMPRSMTYAYTLASTNFPKPEDIAALLRKHFPRLEEIYVSSDDDYSNVIAGAVLPS
ncbi:hypothetical protein PT974_03134 [Cladobotryum mycophilum]|uniref:F-box domain-containing protein n=1 Tax=Cladobotryum mycophilum TaxID=491253 RepID=A0ABR0SRF2_9HYPO